MLLHCDALNPNRWESQLFLSIYDHFDPIDLNRGQAWELAVFMNTRGFLRSHFFALFNWKPSAMNEHVDTVLNFFADSPSMHKAAEDNVNSITLADGLAWLKATLEVKPRYRDPPPFWSQLALNSLFSDDNMTNAEIIETVGNVDVDTIIKWKKKALFDPLTVLPLM